MRCVLNTFTNSWAMGTGGRTMSAAQRRKRHSYFMRSSDELRGMCSERDIRRDKYAEADRAGLIRVLEEDDGCHQSSWVRSRKFEGFFTACIVLNAMTIAIQIDSSHLLAPRVWMLLNFMWFSVFMCEASMKIDALGWDVYIADSWHRFDVAVLALVGVQVAANWNVSVSDSRLYQRYSVYVPQDFVQVVRICRLFRLAQFFKELGVLVNSFLSSIKALFWILILLFIWFFIAACVATVFLGRREFLPSEDEADIKDLRAKFATIPLSMFALFEIMTLEGWVDYVRPVLHSRPHLVVFFVFFIFVSAFFMLNLITAVVVDRTVAAQRIAEDAVAEEEREMRRSRIAFVCGMLRRFTGLPDVNRSSSMAGHAGSDFVQKEDLERCMLDQEVREVMRELGWSKAYLRSMFDLTDTEGLDEVSVTALQRLLEVGHESLNTSSFVRFQLNLMHRLEHQESLVLSVLDALDQSSPGKLQLPESVRVQMQRHSMLGGSGSGSPRGKGSPRLTPERKHSSY
eukprot:TRINITY_DN14302_c0_g1_i2.p1 TRINITY_DN14302_c0_g1~~TRINITY_DN14302_c0_g1_i2.p1  ORF type:complete len:514 (+),score=55.87 TRINITY_DN14302_c0_g1_i2:67-1608(+)